MSSSPVRLQLGTLPEFAPSPTLWPRVQAEHQRRRRRRLVRRTSYGGAIAALLIAAAVLMPGLPDHTASARLAAWQKESQSLERTWQNMRVNASDNPIARADVRLVDQALQAAYDRGATSAELAPLWQKRNQVLRGLIAKRQGALAVTRI